MTFENFYFGEPKYILDFGPPKLNENGVLLFFYLVRSK